MSALMPMVDEPIEPHTAAGGLGESGNDLCRQQQCTAHIWQSRV